MSGKKKEEVEMGVTCKKAVASTARLRTATEALKRRPLSLSHVTSPCARTTAASVVG